MTSTAKDRAVTHVSYVMLPERLPAIPRDQMTEEQRQVTDDLAASRGSVRGPFSATMRSPRLMDQMQKLGACVRYEIGLDDRISRLVTLMVARHWTNHYEWETSIPFALKAGLRPAIIDAIRDGRYPPDMTEDEMTVYQFLSELHTHKGVSDVTYGRVVAQLTERGVIELLAVIGYYTMNAMIMNVARTPVPGGKPSSLPPMPGQFSPEA